MATHFKGPVISELGFSAPVGQVSSFTVDNLKLDDNTLSSEDTNGDIVLAPNGTGSVTATKLAVSASLAVGSGGIAIKAIKSAAIEVIIPAALAAAEAEVTLTITGVAAGDLVQLAPIDAAMETGVGILAVWVSAANTVKLRITNASGSTLTGSTANWNYVWYDLT